MKFGGREGYKFNLEMDVICNNHEGDGSNLVNRLHKANLASAFRQLTAQIISVDYNLYGIDDRPTHDRRKSASSQRLLA